MVDKHIGFDLVVDEFKVRCSKQFEVFEFDPTLATTLHLNEFQCTTYAMDSLIWAFDIE